MLGNFSWICCCLLTFSKLTCLKDSFGNTIRVATSLDPDQDRHTVSPDLGPNCLQTLSADDKSCHYSLARRVKFIVDCMSALRLQFLFLTFRASNG